MTIDPIRLACDLIKCPSVTPVEGGALDLLEKTLENIGFTCHRLTFEEQGHAPVDNLYARIGTQGPNFCFAGHTDVVPPGDITAWSFDPFCGEIRDGWLCGRGASDMKSGVAAFVAAASAFINDRKTFNGSISLLITGDEEAIAINGTQKVLRWLAERSETIDACLVGEPTSREVFGDMAKIGRRGSLNGALTVNGTQGHVAYPHLALNPIPNLLALLDTLENLHLDDGNAHFQPSNLEIVTIDVGNPSDNVIPSAARAKFNIRFNDEYDSRSLESLLRKTLDAVKTPYTLDIRVSGESFLTQPGPLVDLVARSVEKVTGARPELSTTGGTSDARFIARICPVVEFGSVGLTAHKVNEKIKAADLVALTEVYGLILKGFFK